MDNLKGDADKMGEAKAEVQKKEMQGTAGQENGRQQRPSVESGWTLYEERIDEAVSDKKEKKQLYTNNDEGDRKLPGAVIEELLKVPLPPCVYIVNYLWEYFDLKKEFDESAKKELIEKIQAKERPDRYGDSGADALFLRLIKKIDTVFQQCGAVQRKIKNNELIEKKWTEAQIRKLLWEMPEEEFIQTFAPALGLSLEEIDAFLLKAYRRAGLNPYEKEEFILYLAVLQVDSNRAERDYYSIYWKMREAYEECDKGTVCFTGGMKTIWKECEETVARLREEEEDWEKYGKIPAVLEELFKKHKAIDYSGQQWNSLRKKALEKLWKEVCQLYQSDLEYEEKNERDTKREEWAEENNGVKNDRDDDDIWKNTKLRVRVSEEVSEEKEMNPWKQKNKLLIPKDIGDTTLIPAELKEIRNWQEREERVKEEDGTDQTVHYLTLECKYGTWIPAGTVLSVLQKNGKRRVFTIMEEYLGVGSEELRRFLYGATELLDEDEDPEVRSEYEKDLNVFARWMDNTKLSRSAFFEFEEGRKPMAQRNYILTLLFLKFAKAKGIQDMEKKERREKFVVMTNEVLRSLQLPEMYLALPYDVLLYYLLANREPATDFRQLWIRFEEKKRKQKDEKEEH